MRLFVNESFVYKTKSKTKDRQQISCCFERQKTSENTQTNSVKKKRIKEKKIE